MPEIIGWERICIKLLQKYLYGTHYDVRLFCCDKLMLSQEIIDTLHLFNFHWEAAALLL